jgi:large subunit ribosomal protein L32e
MKTLLEIRNKLKLKKPKFIRHDAHKKVRVGLKWRRPKGRQNKMRLHMKGYARGRSTGYGSPVEVRGLSREGLVQNIVSNIKELESLDPKKDGVILSRTLGLKKKQQIASEALAKGFSLLNVDDKKLSEKVTSVINEKKERRAIINKRKASKEKISKSSEKKDSKNSKKEESVDEESKKAQEKKEHDKILTKGDHQ